MASWPDGPILCGIDFSKDSKHAWLVAQALAQQLSRPLIVVTAIDPLLAEAGRSHYGEKFVEENASKDLAKFLGEASVAYTTVVEVGAAGDALVKAAAAQRASLIVVGTRGLGRTKRLFFGSTALRILRTSEHPVLAVPADIETPAKAAGNRFAHLVCGVDFSESSLHAARMASDLGRQISASVTIVHAVARIAVPETWDCARGLVGRHARRGSHVAAAGSDADARLTRASGHRARRRRRGRHRRGGQPPGDADRVGARRPRWTSAGDARLPNPHGGEGASDGDPGSNGLTC